MIGPGNVRFSYAQLEGIWVQAGGNKQYAPMAAAISSAESGGNSAAYGVNTNGSIDRGLWQINSSNGTLSTFDIMGNARAAVQMSNNGTNWKAWCTAYSDAACGSKGGTYLGQGAPYQKYLAGGTPPDLTVPINGTAAATPAQLANSATLTNADLTGCGINPWKWLTNPLGCAGQDVLSPEEKLAKDILFTIVGYVLNPIISMIAGSLGVMGGVLLMGGGSMIMVHSTQTYQSAKQKVGQAAIIAATAGAGGAGAAAGAGAATRAGATGGGSATVVRTTRPIDATSRDVSTQDQLRGQALRYGRPTRELSR